MAQYIDKSALVAEIKKQIGFIPECVNAFDEGEEHAYNHILSFLNTLEAKEVNSTNAFIEKAAKWLEDNVIEYWGHRSRR